MEKFLRSNNFARVIAIFLAVILWLFVTGDKITRTTPSRTVWQGVPLQVENLNPEYVVTDMPTEVDVTLEGLPEDFADLTMQEIEVYVDLADKGPGNHLARVQGHSPRGLSIVLIEPEQVRVSIETYRAEDFEVEVDMIGSPAIGWELVEYTVLPEEVLIGAPESIFENVARIVVLIDKNGMRLIESVEVSPIAYDENGNRVDDLTIDPSLVTVRLEFERIPEPEPDDAENEEQTIED